MSQVTSSDVDGSRQLGLVFHAATFLLAWAAQSSLWDGAVRLVAGQAPPSTYSALDDWPGISLPSFLPSLPQLLLLPKKNRLRAKRDYKSTCRRFFPEKNTCWARYSSSFHCSVLSQDGKNRKTRRIDFTN